jgi:uncharacterized protein (TIGR01244 family)
MNFKQDILPGITIGDQPTEADLADLKAEGFGAIVNLRNDGEPEQPLSTVQEGDLVRALGMNYLHHAVGAAPLTESGIQSVCDFVERNTQGDSRVLLHCRKGGRAAAVLLIQQARANRWSLDETMTKGKALGLQVDGGLRALVEQFLLS